MKTIEDIAHRWAAAKDEVARLKRERAELFCDRERDAGIVTMGLTPCWKLTRLDPDDCDMPGPTTWEHETERADWCPSCVARQAAHEQLGPARRRAGALQGALLRAARRAEA